MGKKGTKTKWGIEKDFVKKVQDFKPDLILVSVLGKYIFSRYETFGERPI